MAIHDIYSKRIRSGQDPEDAELIYDNFSETFRVQVFMMLQDGLDRIGNPQKSTVASFIVKELCREYGITRLGFTGVGIPPRSDNDQLNAHVMNEQEIPKVLDAVELTLRVISGMLDVPAQPRFIRGNPWMSEPIIEELNARFKEHRLGYRYESGMIIRMDSQVMHEEVVKPALLLLGDPRFEGPNHEYLTAHERYRSGHYADCILWSNRAFESMLKIICKDRGWISKDETASKLIHTALSNELLPAFMEDQLTKLSEVLTLGLPKVRNKMAGHGQGEQVVSPPAYFAEYALHLAAANILLLAKAAEKDRSPKGNENGRAEFRSGGHYPLD